MSHVTILRRDHFSDSESFESLRSLHKSQSHNKLEELEVDGFVLLASHRANSIVEGPRIFSDDDCVIAFAGDLVEYPRIPFAQIKEAIQGMSESFLRDLAGNWVVFFLSLNDNCVHILSDRRAQRGCYYSKDANQFACSTHQGFMTCLTGHGELSTRYLFQSILFNVPLDDSALFSNVLRLGPGSKLTYCVSKQSYSIWNYCQRFRSAEHLLMGQESLDTAVDVFQRRIPLYFGNSSRTACALTSGWDGRTIAAFAAAESELHTYGVPGCTDLTDAGKLAASLRLKHHPIHFDSAFANNLPTYMLETTRLSAAEQGVLRSSLLYSYQQLYERLGSEITLSGIAFDMLFRGHAATPSLVSPILNQLFNGTNSELICLKESERLFDCDSSTLRGEYDYACEFFTEAYGDFDNTESHLNFIVYPISNRYFAGENAIASEFTSLRVPSWDNEIIELAYRIEHSTLNFSQFQKGYTRGCRKEMELQSYLLSKCNPEFYNRHVHGIYPAAILSGEFPYQINRAASSIIRRTRDMITGKQTVPLEDWKSWLYDSHRDFISMLLEGSDSIISSYISKKALKSLIAERETRIIGKLLGIEIALRLGRSKWRPFW